LTLFYPSGRHGAADLKPSTPCPMTAVLKYLCLIYLVLMGAGCLPTQSLPVMKPNTMMHRDIMVRESNTDRYARIKSSEAIDQRAKKYEQDGLSPEYARAAAEIEYAKSGR